jgi:hypothetical protein
MRDAIFSFESEAFELPAEVFESELQRRSARQPPRTQPRPNRPFRPHRPVRRVVVPPIVQIAESRCPTAAVLEGYASGAATLEPHHEDMLKRLVDFLQGPGGPVRSIHLIAWSSSGEPSGKPRGIAEQRLENASGRLQELLKAGKRSIPVRGSVHRTRGPERVEIRVCM